MTEVANSAKQGRRKAVRRAGPPPGGEEAATITTPAPAVEAPAETVAPPASSDDVSLDKPAAEPVAAASVADEPAVAEPAVDEPAADEPAVEQSTAEKVAKTPSRRVRTALLVGASVVLIIALLAAGTYLFFDNRGEDRDDALRDRFVQTAQQTALNMTSIHVATAQADVDRLLTNASGDFLAQFDGRKDQFVQVVGQAGVNSDGQIVAAGLESQADNCGVSLVAAHASVTNAQSTDPEPRDFRLRITTCDDNGTMTTTKVEFVP